MPTDKAEMVFTVYNELVRVPLPPKWDIESQHESQDEHEECIGVPIDIITEDCPSNNQLGDQTDQTSRTCLSGAITGILNIFK
jgi:hypothetical protein